MPEGIRRVRPRWDLGAILCNASSLGLSTTASTRDPMRVYPNVLLHGLAALLALVRLTLKVQILRLDKLPAVVFQMMSGDDGLALCIGLVV